MEKGIKEDCLSCQKGRRTFILSGIGNPEAFKETTLEAGLSPVGNMFFRITMYIHQQIWNLLKWQLHIVVLI